MLLFPLLLLAAHSCRAAPQLVAHDDGGDTYAPFTCGPEFPVPFGTVEANVSYSDFFHHVGLSYGIDHGDRVVRSGFPAAVHPGDEVGLYLSIRNVGRLDIDFWGNVTFAVEVPSYYHDVEIKNDTFKARLPDTRVGNWRTLRCEGGEKTARNSAFVYTHPFTLKSNGGHLKFSAVWTAPEVMDANGRKFIILDVIFTMNAGPTGLFQTLSGLSLRYWL